jgi:hypothetical protein
VLQLVSHRIEPTLLPPDRSNHQKKKEADPIAPRAWGEIVSILERDRLDRSPVTRVA